MGHSQQLPEANCAVLNRLPPKKTATLGSFMRLEGSAPIRSLGTTTRRFRRRRRIGFNAPCAERGVAGSLVRKRLEDTKFLITRRYLPESDIPMARLTV